MDHIHNVEKYTALHLVLVYQIMLVLHPSVDLNAQSIRNVGVILLALIRNAKILARDLVVYILSAMFITIFRSALVRQDILEIHFQIVTQNHQNVSFSTKKKIFFYSYLVLIFPFIFFSQLLLKLLQFMILAIPHHVAQTLSAEMEFVLV